MIQPQVPHGHATQRLCIMVVIIVILWPGLGSKGGTADGVSTIDILIHGEGVLRLTHPRRLPAIGCSIVAGAPFHHLKCWGSYEYGGGEVHWGTPKMNFKNVVEWSQLDVSGSLHIEFMCDN